ncbi:hypothetical protein RKD26_006586 [Streptomyces calvus]
MQAVALILRSMVTIGTFLAAAALQHRVPAVGVERRDHQQVGALGEQVLDVADLLGELRLGVGRQQLDASPGRLVLDGLRLRDAERVGLLLRLREADGGVLEVDLLSAVGVDGAGLAARLRRDDLLAGVGGRRGLLVARRVVLRLGTGAGGQGHGGGQGHDHGTGEEAGTVSGALHGDPDPGDAEKVNGEREAAHEWCCSPSAGGVRCAAKEVLHRWKDAVNPLRTRWERGAAGEARGGARPEAVPHGTGPAR